MRYKRLSTELASEEFQSLSQEAVDWANDLFPHYLSYEKTKYGRKVSSSCCHQHREVSREIKELMHYSEEDAEIMELTHNEVRECPFCGKEVTVKNLKMIRTGKSLEKYLAVVFLHVDDNGERVEAQSYWVRKNIFWNPQGWVECMPTRFFTFQTGAVETFEEQYTSQGYAMRKVKRGWVERSFNFNSDVKSYHIHGLKDLEHSFLKYSQYQSWERGNYKYMMQYLGLAALHTNQVEWLMKLGVKRPIENWVYSRRKSTGGINWGGETVLEVLGLTRPELKTYLEGEKSMDTLSVLRQYRRTGVKLTVEQAEIAGKQWCNSGAVVKISKICAEAKVKPEKLWRYLGKVATKEGGEPYTLTSWWDYVQDIKELGYPLEERTLFPRDFWESHDAAYHNKMAIRAKKERDKKIKSGIRDSAVEEKVQLNYEKKLLPKLQKKYECRVGDYTIMAPRDVEDIVVEGVVLAHCVGGYAPRHMNGTLTILFLRKWNHVDAPLVTIELNKQGEIRQIHGYKNDVGTNATQAAEKYKEELAAWMGWVKSGSPRKRNKDVILNLKKKERAA